MFRVRKLLMEFLLLYILGVVGSQERRVLRKKESLIKEGTLLLIKGLRKNLYLCSMNCLIHTKRNIIFKEIK